MINALAAEKFAASLDAWRGGCNAWMAMLLAACEADDLDKFLAKRESAQVQRGPPT